MANNSLLAALSGAMEGLNRGLAQGRANQQQDSDRSMERIIQMLQVKGLHQNLEFGRAREEREQGAAGRAGEEAIRAQQVFEAQDQARMIELALQRAGAGDAANKGYMYTSAANREAGVHPIDGQLADFRTRMEEFEGFTDPLSDARDAMGEVVSGKMPTPLDSDSLPAVQQFRGAEGKAKLESVLTSMQGLTEDSRDVARGRYQSEMTTRRGLDMATEKAALDLDVARSRSSATYQRELQEHHATQKRNINTTYATMVAEMAASPESSAFSIDTLRGLDGYEQHIGVGSEQDEAFAQGIAIAQTRGLEAGILAASARVGEKSPLAAYQMLDTYIQKAEGAGGAGLTDGYSLELNAARDIYKAHAPSEFQAVVVDQLMDRIDRVSTEEGLDAIADGYNDLLNSERWAPYADKYKDVVKIGRNYIKSKREDFKSVKATREENEASTHQQRLWDVSFQAGDLIGMRAAAQGLKALPSQNAKDLGAAYESVIAGTEARQLSLAPIEQAIIHITSVDTLVAKGELTIAEPILAGAWAALEPLPDGPEKTRAVARYKAAERAFATIKSQQDGVYGTKEQGAAHERGVMMERYNLPPYMSRMRDAIAAIDPNLATKLTIDTGDPSAPFAVPAGMDIDPAKWSQVIHASYVVITEMVGTGVGNRADFDMTLQAHQRLEGMAGFAMTDVEGMIHQVNSRLARMETEARMTIDHFTPFKETLLTEEARARLSEGRTSGPIASPDIPEEVVDAVARNFSVELGQVRAQFKREYRGNPRVLDLDDPLGSLRDMFLAKGLPTAAADAGAAIMLSDEDPKISGPVVRLVMSFYKRKFQQVSPGPEAEAEMAAISDEIHGRLPGMPPALRKELVDYRDARIAERTGEAGGLLQEKIRKIEAAVEVDIANSKVFSDPRLSKGTRRRDVAKFYLRVAPDLDRDLLFALVYKRVDQAGYR